jgi:hypothetical protein
MTLTTFPSQPRQSLASQLDRLESILNNLHTTLQIAMCAAVEKAMRQAIQEALPTLLTALLNHPQLLSVLHSRTHAAAPPAPIRAAVCAAYRWLGHVCRTVWVPCVAWLGQAVQHRPWLAVVIKRLCRCKGRVLWACGMGLVMSLVISYAGPWLGLLAGFVVGFLLTLAVQDRHHLFPWLAKQIADD